MRLSRTTGRVSASTSAPTGTLTKKIHSQPAYFVRMPPKSTPAAAPLPPIAPQMPSALLRSEPSSNVVVMIASVAGDTIAAPTPCTARAAISTPIEPARPQTMRRKRKQRHPDHEHPAATEEISCSPAQQQEPAERDRVGVDDPLAGRRSRIRGRSGSTGARR